jgi:hypothetical protein
VRARVGIGIGVSAQRIEQGRCIDAEAPLVDITDLRMAPVHVVPRLIAAQHALEIAVGLYPQPHPCFEESYTG